MKSTRFKPVPPGGMCQYIAPMTSVEDVDADVIATLKRAYDAAG